jgi:hypothetical protein
LDYKRYTLTLLLWFVGVSAQNLPLPKQLSWLAKDVNLIKALQSPSECINTNIHNQILNQQIILGRLAFQSPALLGGQAARKGLSCESCHNSARGNSYFFIENISSHRGTADVSESFFSSTGGNDVFMPVPIPDLADYSQMEIIDRTSAAFRKKIIQLVTVEFDGQMPSAKILDAIQFYLVSIEKKHCDNPAAVYQKDWLYDWNRLIEALGLIEETFITQDLEQRDFLIRIARLILETMHDRFSLAENKTIEKKLIKSSRFLANLSRLNSESKSKKVLDKWNNKSLQLKGLLNKHHEKSAYNSHLLIKYIENK